MSQVTTRTIHFRNSLATYVIPSEDEWVKAAYFDNELLTDPPDEEFRGRNGFWNYPNGTFFQPTGIAFLQWEDGPTDVTEAGDLSINGLMGMLGNVWERNESTIDELNDDPIDKETILRGGAWSFTVPFENAEWYGIHRGLRSSFNTTTPNTGFRVAKVTPIPEPATLTLSLLPLLFALHLRCQRK